MKFRLGLIGLVLFLVALIVGIPGPAMGMGLDLPAIVKADQAILIIDNTPISMRLALDISLAIYTIDTETESLPVWTEDPSTELTWVSIGSNPGKTQGYAVLRL
ncbi:MAG: hypothetical protein JRC53_01125 [Deltaproteobacteria bacterium]|nr:hypothetical protein [Deltaproteobacteria bacterium]